MYGSEFTEVDEIGNEQGCLHVIKETSNGNVKYYWFINGFRALRRSEINESLYNEILKQKDK